MGAQSEDMNTQVKAHKKKGGATYLEINKAAVGAFAGPNLREESKYTAAGVVNQLG